MISNPVAESIEDKHVAEIISDFADRTQFSSIDWELKERPDGDYLIIYLANPTDRFFKILNESLNTLEEENPLKDRCTIKKRPGSVKDRLDLPETQNLRTILSESLTVTKNSFKEDFYDRYIRSVFGAEDQIMASGNHIVYGRRGSGKSSLLAYLYHQIRNQDIPHAWIDMQAYSNRSDHRVITDLLIQILFELKESGFSFSSIESVSKRVEDLDSSEKEDDSFLTELDKLIPKIRRGISELTSESGRMFLFLDDFHVLKDRLQPVILDKLYSICRGNSIFIKMSGIEQFTKTWDASSRQGMESTDDIQIIRLDYNLTRPGKSKEHIHNILDAHARYCGLPSIKYIRRAGVLDRLVWAAAGVPRDALNIFSQALARSTVEDSKKVTVTSINAATSEMAEGKIREIETDASDKYEAIRELLGELKQFCVDEEKINAFLVEIDNTNPRFQNLKELIALRLLHVIHEGITPSKAGRRFIALMLDFSFYVGIRAARSVNLFQEEPKQLTAKELRSLPIFSL
jgi:hypothetical protein